MALTTALGAASAHAATSAPLDDVLAAAECRAADERGIQKCRIGLDEARMAQMLRTQKESQWCWAASIAMVFAVGGFDVQQESVVRENFGDLHDDAVPAADITRLLNRKWQDSTGRTFVSSADATEFAGDLRRATMRIMAELASGHPLILGAARHAVVLAQVEFERFTAEGGIRITGGTVIDPAVGRGVRRMASYEMKPFYVARVRIEGEDATIRASRDVETVAGSTQRVAGIAMR